jgi:ornithine cyclodeaminase/alanine dehydrogenase-like protein (mu-crystallin family)
MTAPTGVIELPLLPPAVFLTGGEVRRLLDMGACIAAVERAFGDIGSGRPIPSAMLGMNADDGSFHVKAALLAHGPGSGTGYFAAKVNANFPSNPAGHGLPTIQGLLLLFDAGTGVPLAVMDSSAITILRTAAATAVAARHLSLPGARTVTIVGCGAQALAQLEALSRVRSIERAFAVDLVPRTAETFASVASATLGLDVRAERDLEQATRRSEIIVTCTSSRRAILGRVHVRDGTFVAAVGADNEHKQEIEPSLMALAAVVTDSTAQCAAAGDLHHAVAAGLMGVEDVRGELGGIVADPSRGRRTDSEVIVYDSTGVAFQDVAAAAVVYERAMAERMG